MVYNIILLTPLQLLGYVFICCSGSWNCFNFVYAIDFLSFFSGKSPCCPTMCLEVSFGCKRYRPLQLVGCKVGKMKVKISLCMLRRHMRSGAHLHSFIICALMGRVVGFTPWSPYSRGKSPGIHWVGHSVGTRAVLEFLKERFDLLLPGIEPRLFGRPVRGLVTIPTTLLCSLETVRKCFNFLMLYRFDW
jgi:hypothetical protein